MARGSMKTAANCVSKCELQDTLSIDRLNAHCVHGHRAVGTLGRGWVQIKNRTSAVHRNGGRAPRVLAVPAWESRCVSNRSSSRSVMGGGLGIKTARSAGTYLVASELQRLGLNDRDPKLLASSIQECRPSAVAQSKSFFPCRTITPPRLERDYPPNLSISISGGKETNRDSLSKGD